jgi:hypothetical protein
MILTTHDSGSGMVSFERNTPVTSEEMVLRLWYTVGWSKDDGNY